jgi:hypothetical protein
MEKYALMWGTLQKQCLKYGTYTRNILPC